MENPELTQQQHTEISQASTLAQQPPLFSGDLQSNSHQTSNFPTAKSHTTSLQLHNPHAPLHVSAKKSQNLKTLILRHSTQIQQSLNFTSLLPSLIHPDLNFMNSEEVDSLKKKPTNSQKANELLIFLERKPISACRKFLASLMVAREHLGHEDLFCTIWPQLSEVEATLVSELCESMSSAWSVSPGVPPSFVELQGDLTSSKFKKVEKVMWNHYGEGQYDKLASITGRLQNSPCLEWDIVGKWFESENCVFIHGCKESDHSNCLNKSLMPALDLCHNPAVQNTNILEGRVRLRLAQIYLRRGDKAKAIENSDKARELLSLTRGYDVAKLLLREAKVLSATQPHRRPDIESLYIGALQNFEEDTYICCRPTVHLSLAAFYLHISFDSAPELGSAPPSLNREEIQKAKAQLEALAKLNLFLPCMRVCEQKLLCAELLRLEGKLDEALVGFKETMKASEENRRHCLVAICKHQCLVIEKVKEKESFLDELLNEISGSSGIS